VGSAECIFVTSFFTPDYVAMYASDDIDTNMEGGDGDEIEREKSSGDIEMDMSDSEYDSDVSDMSDVDDGL
jgi:hypothetical protein